MAEFPLPGMGRAVVAVPAPGDRPGYWAGASCAVPDTDGSFVVDVLPGMMLLGLGAGMAFNPVLLAAMSEVDPADSGLASGVVNTAFMMGGALGLAVLASAAAARTGSMQAAGAQLPLALTGGYNLAFLVGAVFAAVAGLLGALLLRTASPGSTQNDKNNSNNEEAAASASTANRAAAS